MNKYDTPLPLTKRNDKEKLLKDQVQKVFSSQNLETQRQLVNAIAAELQISVLDCAAAFAYLNDPILSAVVVPKTAFQRQDENQNNQGKPLIPKGIRLMRYRLDIGGQHNVDVDEIKKVLVEESGVDIKNITNVRIMDDYTLIDLPDEMPQEIFHHLKTIEINGQKLDIRRVKRRNKRRGNNRNHRQFRPGSLQSANEAN